MFYIASSRGQFCIPSGNIGSDGVLGLLSNAMGGLLSNGVAGWLSNSVCSLSNIVNGLLSIIRYRCRDCHVDIGSLG